MQLPQPQDSFTKDELDRFDVIYSMYYEHCDTLEELTDKVTNQMLREKVKLIYVSEISEMVRERFEHDNNPEPEVP
tara:strand:- start:51 stop:278 length:228 start_codon:yes stop_codon:yes gene_type:complete